jgi:hypothetical protein
MVVERENYTTALLLPPSRESAGREATRRSRGDASGACGAEMEMELSSLGLVCPHLCELSHI